jgi:hypothetical protein
MKQENRKQETRMIYSYFYTLDEIVWEPTPPVGFNNFVRILTDTLWDMGEAIWRVDND